MKLASTQKQYFYIMSERKYQSASINTPTHQVRAVMFSHKMAGKDGRTINCSNLTPKNACLSRPENP